MKDTVITARMKRRELSIVGVCFAVALLTNAVAIAVYGTSWWELFTQIGYVVVITGLLWGVTLLARIVVALFRRRK